jgi:hypothetical protein
LLVAPENAADGVWFRVPLLAGRLSDQQLRQAPYQRTCPREQRLVLLNVCLHLAYALARFADRIVFPKV